MKIRFSDSIPFQNSQRSYLKNNHRIEETFDDFDNLIMRIEYDESDRFIDRKDFDISGKITEHSHKDYYNKGSEAGYIETYKNQTQEYIRHGYTKIENGLKHVVDDFKSISNPQKSYINEFISDLSGKLLRIINNGKITELKK